MVQFFKGAVDPRDAAYGNLADSLGMGLGNGLNTYFANRSLDSVMQDKSLESAPLSKKMEALQSAASPYGQKGQEILQQKFQAVQQGMQEKQIEEQKQTQKQKGLALNKYFNEGSLTPEEQSLFTPQEFTAIYKAKNQKPAGGVTSQPIPPDISQKITGILNQSPDLDADELKNVMDTVGIPPVYSNGYIENRRRTQQTSSEHDIKFHQESAEFDKSLRNNASTAKKQIPLIDNTIKSVKEGKIKPSSMANLFGFFGETGKKIADAFLSKDEGALKHAIPEFLEGRKELFGVRLSDADLRLLQDKLPDLGKSKDANLSILDLMKRAAEKSIKMEKVSQDVLEKKGMPYRSGKLRPLGYERDVMNAFDESEKNENTFTDVPPASKYNGKVIEDDNGRRYKSNGTTWEPI